MATFDQQTNNNNLVPITINNVNNAPIAQDDDFSTDEDATFRVNVLDNDSDPDGDSFSVLSFDTSNTLGVVFLVSALF